MDGVNQVGRVCVYRCTKIGYTKEILIKQYCTFNIMRYIFTILILSAALVEDTIFCMHGGLSPDLTDLKQVNNVPHFCVKLWRSSSYEFSKN